MQDTGMRNCGMLAVLWLLCRLATTTAQADVTQAQRDLVKETSQRLVAVTEAVGDLVWPPSFEIKEGDKISAYASIETGRETEKPTAEVVVYEGLLTKVISGNADLLAFVMGHELGHIVLGHVLPRPGDEKTPFTQAAFSREQEIAADKKGMELALPAGYSFRRAIKGIQRMIDMGLEYSSFEGLSTDHPSWRDRLAFLDKEQSTLWRSTSAFENGTVFLLVEQYAAAERCFRGVTKEFPGCYEGWANLGYALLMQYCDALETDDLRSFQIGQIVCGGFYRRPKSLEALVRGVDEELWWAAVGALREALRLKPDLTLAKANLGVAYLLRPAGKDVGRATQYLEEAAGAAETDSTLDPLARAAVLINAGVADLGGGRVEVCRRRLEKAEEYGRRFRGTPRQLVPTLSVSSALLYNRALLFTRSGRREQRANALSLFERHLQNTSPASAWWPLAYEHYTRLCKEQGTAPKTERELRAKTRVVLRPLTSVQLAPGTLVNLAEGISEVKRRLGPGEAVPVLSGTNLVKLRYPRYGTDLLASDQILAICLHGSTAPAIPLRPAGLGTRKRYLRVGMTQQELEEVVADEDYDFRQLTDPGVNYRFYRNIGLAVRLQKGRVEELVVAQIPERSILGTS